MSNAIRTQAIRPQAIRFQVIMALAISLGAATGFAQADGAAIFKDKCSMCHGPAGIPNPAMAKALGVPNVTDPAVKAMTIVQIETQIKNGKGNMKPITGLTDEQLKAVATYFKSLSK